MNYAQHFNPNKTPQSEKADSRQVKNSAGGYTFQLDYWKRLDRWLILGAEGGTYYATEKKLTRENAKSIAECLDADGPRTVEIIASVSEDGRAPKNDPAIFALALAASHKDPATRRAALLALPRVCRIGTHLFHFVQDVDSFRGWGPGLRRAVSNWYGAKTPDQLCYQLAKYQQRDGWSNRDLLRLSHAEPRPEHAAIYRWVTGATTEAREVAGSERAKRKVRSYPSVGELPAFLAAFDELKTADLSRTIKLIEEHGFTHEMIASEHKNSAHAWAALLEKMPPGALVRNLGKMTAVGLLKPMSSAIATVAERLTDESALKKARVHPIAMLSALAVYRQGHGDKGKLTWSPVPQVVDALDDGFYASFGAVEATGKRIVQAIDISGSMMSGPIAGLTGVVPRQAAAVLAMVTARVEKRSHIIGYSRRVVDLSISPKQRLDDVMMAIKRREDPTSTDCAQPMLWAASSDIGVDAFFSYTDNETWVGAIHPHQALNAYRSKSGIQAKLAVVAMTATECSIADPSDPWSLNVVGMDTATPNLLASFTGGE